MIVYKDTVQLQSKLEKLRERGPQREVLKEVHSQRCLANNEDISLLSAGFNQFSISGEITYLEKIQVKPLQGQSDLT